MPVHHLAEDTGQLTVELTECLVIMAPKWFEREDFLDWRQGKAPEQWCGPACWNPQEPVFLVNLLALPSTEAELFDLPRCVYDTFEELAGDGWVVD